MVEINNLTGSRIDKTFLKNLAGKVLKKEGAKPKEFSVAVIGDKRMKELNGKYRKKNKITDVLSFKYGEQGDGEVAICYGEVKRNSKKHGSTFKKELGRVLIHGILHILGHTHQSMKKKEIYYLSQIK